MTPVTTTPPEHGTTTVQPTSTATPNTTPDVGWFSRIIAAIENWLNPFSGTGIAFLPNALLVLVGIALGLGALLISQKETVIQVARTAAEV